MQRISRAYGNEKLSYRGYRRKREVLKKAVEIFQRELCRRKDTRSVGEVMATDPGASFTTERALAMIPFSLRTRAGPGCSGWRLPTANPVRALIHSRSVTFAYVRWAMRDVLRKLSVARLSLSANCRLHHAALYARVVRHYL
jgi:hypothetical protein